MNQWWIRIAITGWLAVLCGNTCAQTADARDPEGNPNLSHWLPERIRQLETERDRLLAEISTLPQFEPAVVTDRLGYHSGYADQDEETGVHQLTVHFRYRPSLGAIALVPAINPRDRYGGSYAFPRRFRIEVLMATSGTWSDAQDRWIHETFEWIEVANWLEEDFPDPGRYPVFFPVNPGRTAKVRMTVPYGHQGNGQSFYALEELFLFQSVDGQIADNMAVWGPTSIEAFEVSDSFSLPPFWDVGYLYDGFTGLGSPLSEERVEESDLMVSFEGEEQHEPVQIVIDLGQTRPVGRVEFWPTAAPKQIAAPLYAFPGKIRVDLSNDPGFRSAVTYKADDARAQMYHDNLLRMMCEGYEARYIRLTLEELREENGRRILGIGEITVSEHGKVFSLGCEVTAKGLPETAAGQLDRLVDGNCQGRRVLSETEWIIGLARRRPLDLRLAEVERDLADANDDWAGFRLRTAIRGGGLLFFALVAAIGLHRRQRRKGLRELKHRITRDLHDEVGSSLGGLSLTSEELEEMTSDEGMKRELGELSLMAREACASLREVVWVTDQDIILLPALIENMIERAERVLRGVELTVDIAPDIPDVEVALSCKRHLIMFFREAVHNCARHASAKKVRVSARSRDRRMLELQIEDDGVGFDPSGVRRGWGLDSMKKRGEELNGTLDLRSVPGEGTLVQLTLPLNALTHEPTRTYKTSN